MNILSAVTNKLFLFLILFLISPAWAACPAPNAQAIAIDIGHSPRNPGATSARGVSEYEFNRNLAERLLHELQQAGFSNAFILTENNPEMPLYVRASLANVRNVALLLSIHHDSVQPQYLSEWQINGKKQYFSDQFQGYSLFISHKNPQFQTSLSFAEILATTMREAGFRPSLHHAEAIAGENRPLLNADKGIYRYDDLIILQNTKVPAVLLESGVIVNRNEEILLSNPVYQNALITAISAAVAQFMDRLRTVHCTASVNP